VNCVRTIGSRPTTQTTVTLTIARDMIHFHCFGIMKVSHAVDSLAALAQETRLNIFRLLVRNAPDGLAAGQIARRLHLPGPTLSFHLNVLAAAELVLPHKNGRSIRYSASLQSVNRLTDFLMENCCGGRGCAPAEKGT
jgi:ArsR family transcriptional regulator, arsenate/arsenite/antimonite-responsive transcriptional repressor